jgi:hypothetical protein
MSLCYDFQKWTIISLASIAISLTIGLLMQYAHGQSSDKFLTYTNNHMNITIQYPENWEVQDINSTNSSEEGPHTMFKPLLQFEPDPNSVSFERPDTDRHCIGCYFKVFVEEVEPYLDTDTMTLKNTSLQQRVQQELNSGLSHYYKLISQSEVTVAGNTGWKIEWSSWSSEYHFYIITLANGKFYILNYGEDNLKVPETLPVANKMVETFQIKS